MDEVPAAIREGKWEMDEVVSITTLEEWEERENILLFPESYTLMNHTQLPPLEDTRMFRILDRRLLFCCNFMRERAAPYLITVVQHDVAS